MREFITKAHYPQDEECGHCSDYWYEPENWACCYCGEIRPTEKELA